ncbi:helix-turn-helix domain-containing protein [Yoonia sp.]|uniref:helix-turn-helix domain-containing protein n=1 Tax=Yoonia sp. TaxID=2212373 RepID=UPI002DFE21B1|nr:helix-turn-helix domain-containing protein [Yoonia sp.]
MSRTRFIAWVTGRPIDGWSIASITDAVSRKTGISAEAIMSADRTIRVSSARQEVMRRAYATGRYSLPEIGRALGRDHTTVGHGIRRATERLGA